MNNTKSSLFLMEQLIAITVFAVCAAVCAAIFVNAYTTANGANDLNHALVAARNGAEVLKATDCLEETAVTLGGYVYNPEKAVVYFDNNWQATYSSYASFVLTLESSDPRLSAYNFYLLSIHNDSGEVIISFFMSPERRA